MLANVGAGNKQYDDVFLSSKNTSQSNAIVGLYGQKAGKRRRLSRKKRGGYGMLGNAVVPLSILAMQQTYNRKKRGGRSRTRGRTRGRGRGRTRGRH
jgi:hypothetical protein